MGADHLNLLDSRISSRMLVLIKQTCNEESINLHCWTFWMMPAYSRLPSRPHTGVHNGHLTQVRLIAVRPPGVGPVYLPVYRPEWRETDCFLFKIWVISFIWRHNYIWCQLSCCRFRLSSRNVKLMSFMKNLYSCFFFLNQFRKQKHFYYFFDLTGNLCLGAIQRS